MRDEDIASREAEALDAWRLKCFMDAGCNYETAGILASASVDHHEFEQLIARGCGPDLAARLLLPLNP